MKDEIKLVVTQESFNVQFGDSENRKEYYAHLEDAVYGMFRMAIRKKLIGKKYETKDFQDFLNSIREIEQKLEKYVKSLNLKKAE